MTKYVDRRDELITWLFEKHHEIIEEFFEEKHPEVLRKALKKFWSSTLREVTIDG